MTLESSIQAADVKYARQMGVIAIKLSTLGQFGTTGWPDYMFLAEAGRVWFKEYKALGKKPTPRQEAKIKAIRDLGFHVYVVDNVAQGKKITDNELWR